MSTATLYIVFLVIGLLAFAGVYFYSQFQIKRRNSEGGSIHEDLLMKKAEAIQRRNQNVSQIENNDIADDSNVSVGGVTAKVTPHSEMNAPSFNTPVEMSEVDGAPLDQLAEELLQSSDQLGDETRKIDDVQRLEASSQDLNDVVHKKAPQIEIFSESDVIESQKQQEPIQKESVETKLSKNSDEDSFFNRQETSSSIKTGNSESSVAKKESHQPRNVINDMEIVASTSGDQAVLRDDVLSIYRNFDYLFTRKTGIFGKNGLTHIWENIELADATSEFNDVAVSLQLADKTGAMTRKESNTFSTMALELADRLKRKVTFSLDIDAAIDRGRELDEMARRYDAMVVCNVVPKRKQGFRSTDIKSCTRDLNMVQSSNGVFGRFDKVGQQAALRYSLAVAGDSGKYISLDKGSSFYVRDIVLFVKVPLVIDPVNAFDLMVEDARRLAAWLDGKLVDRNSKNMTSRTLEALSEQIVNIEQQMASEGVVPGSELCKKLF